MITLHDDFFTAVLKHLPERNRVRLLCTCKKMREWLRKRVEIARAAFSAFKAQSLKRGWILDNDMAVSITAKENRHDRTVTWFEKVRLQTNGLISIHSFESVWLNTNTELHKIETTRFYTPWFRKMMKSPQSQCRYNERTKKVRDDLREASPH
jgi:hypothetical protein